MAADWIRVDAASARALLAHRLAGDDVCAELGEIVLASHQVHAARRLLALLREHRGALLADDVGLGKTFIALAVARAYRHVVILHPASLRDMWTDALHRAGVAADRTSYESLSRRLPLGEAPDLVILDEAHHARSTNARRYPRIASLTARSHTLLLSATPIHNRLDDLRALLALFLGERTRMLDAASLRELVVRRTRETVPSVRLPASGAVQWIDAVDDHDVVSRLQGLPAPVPVADGGDGGPLLAYGLIRQWASSRAALLAALRRRLGRAAALEDMLATGRFPTRGQLEAFTLSDDAMQLAMPEMLDTPAIARTTLTDQEHTAMRASIADHRIAVRELLDHLARRPDVDLGRATALHELRRRHRGEKILAFTEYAETARAYWRALRGTEGVGLLTARGGTIASGRIARARVLQRFAPVGMRCPPPPAIEGISLLVTTDLLAEGIDLRDATVVVHLDLPWSPARMEQRAGRTRRLGSATASVAVYALHPPHAADALLRIEDRLRCKTAVARDVIGSAAERMSASLDRIACWRTATVAPECCTTFATAIASRMTGWLAAVAIDGRYRVAACIDGEMGEAPALLERAIDIVESSHAPPVGADDAVTIAECLAEARRWAAGCAAEVCVAASPPPNGVTRLLLDRLARVRARMPHDQRAAAASRLAEARAVLVATHGAGLEHALERLTRDPQIDDAAWLQAVIAAAVAAPPVPKAATVAVLIAFGPAKTTSPARAPTTRS